jgi:Mn2+/Fe2+ NRAMP family transporter
MAFEPTAWRLYCPECGHLKISKTPDGSFSCPVCGCEFRHNWKAWIITGTPFCALFLIVMLDFMSLVSPSRGLIISLVVVSMVVAFVSPDSYRVVKHGQLAKEDSVDQKDAA